MRSVLVGRALTSLLAGNGKTVGIYFICFFFLHHKRKKGQRERKKMMVEDNFPLCMKNGWMAGDGCLAAGANLIKCVLNEGVVHI